MGSIDRNKLIKIGVNHNSHYIVETGHWSTMIATLFLNLDGEKLILDITRKYKNTDGKLLITHIGYFHVGILKKPNKRSIAKILKDNKQTQPFGLSGWYHKTDNGMTLNELLSKVMNGNIGISRLLKIAELKRKLKDG